MTNMYGKKIVLGITGGIAAYKSVELCRLLVKAGCSVHVVMTEAATHFVGAATFQALSGHTVWLDMWDTRMHNSMAHIDLTRDADAMLIAPVTADSLARLAQGCADDLLSTLCLARTCPLLLAPAMNRQMWQHPATQRNIRQLQADGALILGPAYGEQACGETGAGRMLEPLELLAELSAFFQPKLLQSKKILLTAGPTFEAIDPVRGITNLSSGAMGFALARACAEAGGEVTLVSGPVVQTTPLGVTRVNVVSAAEMDAAVMAQVAAHDIFIAVAAVADYRPQHSAEHKIKKSAQTLTLDLERTRDILATVAALPDAPFCVGFAAESQDLDHYAESKRQQKNLALVVGNLVQDGLGGADNQVVLYDAHGRHPLARANKLDVAHQIVAHMAKLLAPQAWSGA